MGRNPNGEGTYFSKIIKNKVRYYWRVNYQGKQIEKSASTRAELKQKVLDWKRNIAYFGFDPYRQTLADFAQSYFKVCTNNLKQHTIDWYKSISKLYIEPPPLGKKQLAKLDPMTIENYLRSLSPRLSAGTISGIRRCLHVILNGALKQGYIAHNPCTRAKGPKSVHKEIPIPSVEKVKEYLAIAKEGNYVFTNGKFGENDGTIYMKEEFYSVFLVSLFCGLRRGEVYGLKWDNIDLEKGTMYVAHTLVEDSLGKHLTEPKTECSRRKISMPNNVIERLQEWQNIQNTFSEKYGNLFQNDLNLVFPNTFGKPVNMTTVNRGHWYKFRKVCNLPSNFHWHYWRHWHVSYLVSLGVDIAEITRRMGHADSSVTYRVYTHAFEHDDSSVVDAINKAWK
ncbi:MAG: site-specific integrase [Phascolarctobacterium sp.]|nr:site-specific integrase [Phascolarctobacterium sp.]